MQDAKSQISKALLVFSHVIMIFLKLDEMIDQTICCKTIMLIHMINDSLRTSSA
ncbi:hypothetical protein GCM10027155_20980 [Acinetobacter apis]